MRRDKLAILHLSSIGIGEMNWRKEAYGVPFREGVDVEEGENFVRFEELEGGDVSCLFATY